MSKKYITVLWVLLAVCLIGGVYYWWSMSKSSVEQANVSQQIVPTIDTGAVNPMESAQSANPYDKTNPFENVKVNPFE